MQSPTTKPRVSKTRPRISNRQCLLEEVFALHTGLDYQQNNVTLRNSRQLA
ncbi:hypothetical protein VB735_29320 [Halotia wernerae UHCC 0503]|nr:hypothetical protein [Halotia wernerae UHCC 0503]